MMAIVYFPADIWQHIQLKILIFKSRFFRSYAIRQRISTYLKVIRSYSLRGINILNFWPRKYRSRSRCKVLAMAPIINLEHFSLARTVFQIINVWPWKYRLRSRCTKFAIQIRWKISTLLKSYLSIFLLALAFPRY